MAARVCILGVDGFGQRSDRLDVRGPEFLVLGSELLGAFADLALQVLVHVLEFEVLFARDLVESLDLTLEVVVIEGLAQRRLQLVVVPRLGDQPVDLALVDGLDRDVHFGVAGEHHAYDVTVPFPYGRKQIDAAHFGHALVADDDLGTLSIE